MTEAHRQYPRVSKLHLVAYVNRDAAEQRTPVSMGRVLDLSPGGIGMEVFEEIKTGSVMEMEIDLRDTILRLQGTVVHVRPEGDDRWVVGVKFPEPQPQLEQVGGK